MAGLFNRTQEEYYQQSQTFESDGTAGPYTLLNTFFPTVPTAKAEIRVFVDGAELDVDDYEYNGGNGQLTLDSAPLAGVNIVVRQIEATEDFGTYQYVALTDIVNNFMIAYVGEGKIISKASRTDVSFHAKRGLAEFSYDTLQSHKSQEIEVPPSLIVPLPHDYVNYTSIVHSDNQGIERRLYPVRYSSNPKSLLQDANFDYIFDNDGTLLEQQPSDTWGKFKDGQAGTTESNINQDDSSDIEFKVLEGRRYGITPEFAQDNGSYYIDLNQGRIHFSSGLSGKTITIKYISDTLGTDGEMRVHKFAEEALYKHIAYAVLSSKVNIPEYVVRRYKQERYAALRNAKIRLSNLKSEELAQVMRNKSKQIKH